MLPPVRQSLNPEVVPVKSLENANATGEYGFQLST